MTTHCLNKGCGKQLHFRRPSERGKKKFCSITCVGVSKHGPVVYGVSRETRDRIDEVKHLLGTDIPENIARRTGYTSVGSMIRALDRAREFPLAKRIRDEHRRYLEAVEVPDDVGDDDDD